MKIVTPGPLLPLAKVTGAAAQLHQTGHSCIVQHFRRVKVGRADEAVVYRACANVDLSRNAFHSCAVGKTSASVSGFNCVVRAGTADFVAPNLGASPKQPSFDLTYLCRHTPLGRRD